MVSKHALVNAPRALFTMENHASSVHSDASSASSTNSIASNAEGTDSYLYVFVRTATSMMESTTSVRSVFLHASLAKACKSATLAPTIRRLQLALAKEQPPSKQSGASLALLGFRISNLVKI